MPAEFRNRIVVLIRFSYLAESGFRMSRDGPDAARRRLYDPARLERRFRLFQTLALPSLAAQDFTDFDLVVLTGSDFPETALARLRACLSPLANARIVTQPPLTVFAATRRAFDHVLTDDTTHLTSVRMDDDDAIATDLIGRIHDLAPRAIAMSAGRPAVVAHNSGLFLDIAPGGNTLRAGVELTPVSVGPALIAPASHRETIHSRNHRLLPQFFDCWTDAATPAYIRTIHRDNDSRPHETGQTLAMNDARIDRLLQTRFATTRAALMAIPA